MDYAGIGLGHESRKTELENESCGVRLVDGGCGRADSFFLADNLTAWLMCKTTPPLPLSS